MTVAVVAELTAVAATTKAVTMAATMAAIVVAAVTVTATAIDGKDIVVSFLDMYCTKVLMYPTMVLMACLTKVRR